MKHWLSAFRLRTLPLAVSSILVGSALAYFVSRNITGEFKPAVLWFALLTAILLQVLSNLANDLGDHQHGTDNKDRVGPERAVQSGAISPAAMNRAMIIFGTLVFVSGCALITVALGFSITTLVFLVLGLTAIGAAVKYTFGKSPYGYAGLGDVSVFLFFGIVGVCGTFYLHTRLFEWPVLLPAVAFGCFSTGVLNVNNMRDIANDAASGKRTLVVRMGSAKAKVYHTMLLASGIVSMIYFNRLFDRPLLFAGSQWIWISLLTLPGFIIHLKRVLANTEPRLLDPQLKTLAMTTFLTAILFSLGLILA
ncbi:MAG: 1,4-dihydroxy-2-naphthoate polyprenyltransferase [Flavobacteriales bacterium]|nr:1,4-dihydroxy-2-naphthoate polyprenyltransferase [Flavobacteriales bacterium]